MPDTQHPASRPSHSRRTTRPGRPRMIVRLPATWMSGIVCVLFAVLVVPLGGQEKPMAQVSEEQVKTAILVGFARATEWPAGTFSERQKKFVIGMFGKDTLGEDATRIFSAPKGGAVRFKVINDETEARACHVVFFPRSERRRARELVERLKGAPILLVGEWENFLDQNGMVNLVPKDNEMKFEINLDPVKAANLRIPAKVLAAALSVRGKYD